MHHSSLKMHQLSCHVLMIIVLAPERKRPAFIWSYQQQYEKVFGFKTRQLMHWGERLTP